MLREAGTVLQEDAIGEAINKARIALVDAATVCLTFDDFDRVHALIRLIADTQKQIPAAWLQAYDEERLARISSERK